jgi:hypothetical protein
MEAGPRLSPGKPLRIKEIDGRDDWIRTSDPHNPMMGIL